MVCVLLVVAVAFILSAVFVEKVGIEDVSHRLIVVIAITLFGAAVAMKVTGDYPEPRTVRGLLGFLGGWTAVGAVIRFLTPEGEKPPHWVIVRFGVALLSAFFAAGLPVFGWGSQAQ